MLASVEISQIDFKILSWNVQGLRSPTQPRRLLLSGESGRAIPHRPIFLLWFYVLAYVVIIKDIRVFQWITRRLNSDYLQMI